MASTNDPGSSPKPEMEENRVKFEAVEGVLLPEKMVGKVKPMSAHIQEIRQMKLREDDVLLCTYPKTGTHWLWEVCSMLRQGKADYDKRTKVQLMMELVDVQVLDEQPSPRMLNTHLAFFMLPVQEIRDRRTKIVHVYRNPKDVAVSLYFMAQSANFDMASLEFGNFVDFFLSDKAPFGGFFWYLKQMHDFMEANPDISVFTVSFEDMKKDPVSNIRRLANFLEISATDELCKEIAEACSFQKMRENDKVKDAVHFGGGDIAGKRPPNTGKTDDELSKNGVSNKTDDAESKNNDANNTNSGVDQNEDGTAPKTSPHRRIAIYRKGEVGDWKNYFTVANSEKVDAVAMEKMKGLPFTLQYE